MTDLSTIGIEEVGDDLGVRAYNILKRMGVDTCEQLLQVTVQDLNGYCNRTGIGLGLPAFHKILDTVKYLQQVND